MTADTFQRLGGNGLVGREALGLGDHLGGRSSHFKMEQKSTWPGNSFLSVKAVARMPQPFPGRSRRFDNGQGKRREGLGFKPQAWAPGESGAISGGVIR